jgi:methylated-DNA-[protein]-cysteine S-methyltransferase
VTKAANMPVAQFTITDSAIGPLLVAAHNGKLVAIKFHADERRLPQQLDALTRELRGAYVLERNDRAVAPIARHLREYLLGKRKDLDLAFDVSWVPGFRRDVLLEVARVPRGDVASYAEIARRCGRPRAFRAVGNTMRTNPIPLVIPCHRIVASGGIGGYGGGLPMKRQLLALEGATVA